MLKQKRSKKLPVLAASTILVVICLLVAALLCSTRSKQKNAKAPNSVPNNLIVNSIDLIITIEKDEKIDQITFASFFKYDFIDPEEQEKFYKQLGEFGGKFKKIANDLENKRHYHGTYKDLLALDIKNNKINLYQGAFYGLLNDLEFYTSFYKTIEKIEEELNVIEFSENDKEKLKILLRVSIYDKLTMFTTMHAGYLELIIKKITNFDVFLEYQEIEKIQYSILSYKLHSEQLELGNPKYNKAIVLGSELLLIFYQIKDIKWLKYNGLTYFYFHMLQLFNLDENNAISGWRMLSDKDIQKMSNGNNDSIVNINKEKSKLGKISKQILKFLVDKREKYNITNLKTLVEEYFQVLRNIRKEIKPYTPSTPHD